MAGVGGQGAFDFDARAEGETQGDDVAQGEKKLTKFDNVVKHEDTIFTRPKRMWFQSNKERDDGKKGSRKQKGLGPSARKVSEEDQKKKAEEAFTKSAGENRKELTQ